MNHPSPNSNEKELGSSSPAQPAPAHEQQPPALLLPTKVNEFVTTRTTSGRNSTTSSSHQSVSYEAFPRGQASRWTAQPVLEWIESLAAATEANDRRGPMCVGTALLSKPAPPLPRGAASSSNNNSNDKNSSSNANDKNEQAHFDATLGNTIMPRLWDVSYIDQHDPMAWTYTQQINGLAAQLEGLVVGPHQQQQHHHPSTSTDTTKMMTTTQVIPTKASEHTMAEYRLLQTRVEFTFGRIVGQQHHSINSSLCLGSNEYEASAAVEGETRKLLDALYQETIAKLRSLISDDHQHLAGKSVPSASKKLSKILPAMQQFSSGSLNKTNSKQPEPMSKPNFAKYMTSWLRDNWTNPYPDEQGLAEMAAHCGTTVQVISNWLINARTRKWRPAIVKATGLGRPADLLLEDSVRIFDGKPVRDLNESHPVPPQQQQQQQHHPHHPPLLQHQPQQQQVPSYYNEMPFDDEDDGMGDDNDDDDSMMEQQGGRHNKRFRSAF